MSIDECVIVPPILSQWRAHWAWLITDVRLFALHDKKVMFKNIGRTRRESSRPGLEERLLFGSRDVDRMSEFTMLYTVKRTLN